MQILSLELKNIKSYGADRATIPFGAGLNLIKGNNGAGKSTVLEAIGYVLFDSEPYRPIQNFVRKGQKNGEIIVTVLSSVDDREYQVIRGVGKPLYYVFDPELKDKVTSAADDTRDWLRQHLGIDPDIDLQALFRDAVGVPQGTMTAVFLGSVGIRQKTFDTLLQVEEYKTAFENLRGTVHHIDGLQRQNDKELARLSGKLERLPQVRKEIREIEGSLKDNRAEIETLNEKLGALDAMLDNLDAQSQAIDDLERQVATQESQIQTARTNLDHAIQVVDESRRAAQTLQETAEAHTQYDLAGQELQQLEARWKDRDRWQKARTSVDQERFREQTQLDNVDQQLQDIAQAEKDVINLEPLARQQAELETDLQTAQVDLHRYEQLSEVIARAKSALTGLQADMDRLDKELKRRSEIEGRLAEQKRERDALNGEIGRITEEITPLDVEFLRLKTALGEQEKRDDARKHILKRIDEINQALEGQHDRLNEIQAEIARRQELQQTLENLEEQQAAAQKSESDAQAAINNADHQHQEIERFRQITDEAETVCPICQRPLDAEARANSLAHYAVEAQCIEAERTQAQTLLSESQRTQKTLAKSIKTTRKALEKLANEIVASHIKDEIARQDHELQTQTQALADVSDAPEQVAQLTGDLEAVEAQVNKLNARKQALEADQQNSVQAIEVGQQSLTDLARPVELEQKQHEYAALAEEIARDQESAADLANSEQRCREFRLTLHELGNPRRDYDIASKTANSRAESERVWNETQERINDLDRQIGEYEQALAEYATLDDDLDEARRLQASNLDGHEQYIRSEPLAAQLADREARQGQLESEHVRLQQDLDELKQQYEEQVSGYDAEQHKALKQSRQVMQDHVNRLSGEIASTQQRFDALEAERDGLFDLEARRDELEAEANQLQAENAALEFVRNTIRDAGPYITKQLIRLIAAEANQIFGEIIGDYNLVLDWQEDYGIVITQHGKVDEPREFKLLSGGEQMAAALSVRLALLARLSNIRFAFFDEPTSNLDGTRRTQLAQNLNAIRSLRQVFVISHDDTFEEASQHVIHIQKTDDMSQVEVL